jgi:TrpR-related protein YerC/YecD
MREYWYEKEIKGMVSEVSKITDCLEMERYLGKILTPREINDMARRLKISKMLEEGKSYSEISNAIGASPTLISKVSAQIGFGFRRSAKVPDKKKEKVDPSKYLGRKIKYKGVDTGLKTKY